MKKVIVDCKTGVETITDLTPEEEAAIPVRQAAAAVEEAKFEVESKIQKRIAKNGRDAAIEELKQIPVEEGGLPADYRETN